MGRTSLAPSSPDDILAARRARLRNEPGEPIDGPAVKTVPKEQVGVIYDTQGHATSTIRRINPFQQIARDRGGSPQARREAQSMAAHGACLLVLYAQAHSIDGGRDLTIYDYIDREMVRDEDYAMYRRALARGEQIETLRRVMSQCGAVSAAILTGLCHDWFYGAGKTVSNDNGRREAPWRAIVRSIMTERFGRKLTTHNEESLLVWSALTDLSRARW